jgi:hypothetical protein
MAVVPQIPAVSAKRQPRGFGVFSPVWDEVFAIQQLPINRLKYTTSSVLVTREENKN